MQKTQKKLIVIGLVIVAGILALIRFVFMGPAADQPADSSSSASSESGTAPATDSGENKTVTATKSYMTPGGEEETSFSLTVASDGTIVDATAEIVTADRESREYQQSFVRSLPAAVVGKKLSALKKVDRVGRASLTTDAFNASLSALQSQV